MWSLIKKKYIYINIAINARWKNKFFLELFKMIFQKTFFQYKLKTKKNSLKIWDHIFKTVLSQDSFMFSVLYFLMENKKKHWKPNTSVLVSTTFCPFCGIFAALQPSF